MLTSPLIAPLFWLALTKNRKDRAALLAYTKARANAEADYLLKRIEVLDIMKRSEV